MAERIRVSVLRQCKRCGYEWQQKLNPDRRPKQCPDCKNRRWDQDWNEGPASQAPAKIPPQNSPGKIGREAAAAH